MSVTLQEVIEAAGYDLTTKEDIIWLLSKESEFNDLIDSVNDLLDAIEENEYNAELAQEQADELRQQLKEEGITQ